MTTPLMRQMASKATACWFRGHNGVEYRGNLVSYRNGVAKVVYMLATAIPTERAEAGIATAYVNREDWERISFAIDSTETQNT